MKPISPKTRKPVDQLRAPDFDKYPIWEFASDEESNPDRDETWVRPVVSVGKTDDSLLVASDFLLGSGAAERGFVTVYPQQGGEYKYGGGVILKGNDYLFLPIILKPEAGKFFPEELIVQRCQQLKVSKDELAQTIFRLRVLLPRDRRYRTGYLYTSDTDQ